MNRRQKKKQFKRRFGFNPPRSISIKAATYIMERRKNIITAFEKIKKAILNLCPPTKEYVQELQNIVLQDKHIIGVHDLIVHNYGPGRVYASLHAEVPANMDMMEAHDYIDMAERRVEKRMKCFISIHMDPVVTDDEVINHLRNMTTEVVKSVGEELDIHDFRTVKGPYITNLIFDVLVPYNYHLSDDEIKKQIQKKITEKQSECRAVIKIDKSYTG